MVFDPPTLIVNTVFDCHFSGVTISGHHWASWTITRTCNEARALHIGYIMRKRICLDDNNYELDKKYCGLYTTKPCVRKYLFSV